MSHVHVLGLGGLWGVGFAEEVTLGEFRNSPARVTGWSNLCSSYIRSVSVTFIFCKKTKGHSQFFSVF